MIWSTLLYAIAQANEWTWSLLDGLPLHFVDATYDLADQARSIFTGGMGLDILPIGTMVFWVRMGFWSFGLALLMRFVSKVLSIAFGSRSPS